MLKIPCEVYSRVVGYLRPVQSWHKAKQQEFEDRVTFRPLTEEEMKDKEEEEKDVSV